MAQKTDISKMETTQTVTNNHKLTAVEWFYQRILAKDIKEVYEQAKAMEKEQIERAYHQGVVNEISIFSTPEAEEYYNETYNKQP